MLLLDLLMHGVTLTPAAKLLELDFALDELFVLA
jgi:hypothetical protein